MAGESLDRDQERLAKLWDAYEAQEKELELAMKNIAKMESKITEMDRVNTVLKKALEDRDKEIRDLELKVIGLEEDNSKYQPKINELENLYKEEKERYSKLFAITEELEDDLAKAREEITIKDKWFEKNVGMLENIRESIIDRNIKLKDMEIVKPEEDTSESQSSSIDAKSEEPKEEDEKITFKTVELQKDEPSEEKKIEEKPVQEKESDEPSGAELEKMSSEPTKNEVIYEFTKIPDVDTEIAEKLYIAGYTSMNKLKESNTEDIAQLDGISPTVARKIRTSLHEI
jgi:DNA repair exonuclease SbcCD ATPase subunit